MVQLQTGQPEIGMPTRNILYPGKIQTSKTEMVQKQPMDFGISLGLRIILMVPDGTVVLVV